MSNPEFCPTRQQSIGVREEGGALVREPRWAVSPAILRQLESLGFVPGSGNPVAWMVQKLSELQDIQLINASIHKGIAAGLKEYEAEIAKLRALVPAVEGEWQPSDGRAGATRSYVAWDWKATAMWVRPDATGAWVWTVYPLFGPVHLAHGTAPSLAEAQAACEKAARELGIPL